MALAGIVGSQTGLSHKASAAIFVESTLLTHLSAGFFDYPLIFCSIDSEVMIPSPETFSLAMSKENRTNYQIDYQMEHPLEWSEDYVVLLADAGAFEQPSSATCRAGFRADDLRAWRGRLFLMMCCGGCTAL